MNRHQWRGRGRQPPRVAPLVLAVGLALALGGCLFDTTPAPPATPVPTPTPPPTPTPTVQARVAYPTAAPPGPPTPLPTPTPTPVVELRGAGRLLYIGTLGGRTGVIAVNADGSDRVLLAEGAYTTVRWSSDGARFAATNTTGSGSGGGPIQIDLFTDDGRRLQRFAFEGFMGEPSWSPDGRQLVLTVTTPPASNTSPDRSISTTWLLDEGGVRELTLGGQTYAGPWTPDGRLILAVVDDTDGDGRFGVTARRTLWTVDAAGGDARRLELEDAFPLGWTPDRRTLYAVGGFQAVKDAEGHTSSWPTRILALDMASGAVRTVVTIDELVARLPRAADPSPALRLGWGNVAPSGDRLALALHGGPDRWGGPSPSIVVVIDGAGNPIWRDDAPVGGFLQGMVWSPDGARLAVFTGQMRPVQSEAAGGLRVITIATGEAFAIPDSTIPNTGGIPDIAFRWSPDGRWLAIGRSGGLTIAAATPPARSWALAPGGRAPDWRPAPGR